MSTQERDDNGNGSLNAYATLLTRPSYLAGALLLAYTLHHHSPTTPLIIMYTPETMSDPAVAALRAEAKYSNTVLYPVEHLRLPVGGGDDSEGGMVAERFIDTWTKLRVFEVLEVEGRKVERLCFLDADMMIFSDPSPYIFSQANDAYLAGGDAKRLVATHICVCNLDGDAWAPASWTKENCAHSYVTSPQGVPEVKAEPSTMAEMNTGTFAFRPSPALASFVLAAFDDTPPRELRRLKFPDQDFLNIVFAGRWRSVSWRVNALKTWRYWHPRMWADDEVTVLHYIVDKPWAARVQTSPSGAKIAGYKGDDGETHGWWWDVFARWEGERRELGEAELLDTTARYVAGVDGKDSEEMRAVGGGAQAFAKKWADGKPVGDVGGDFGQGPHGPILRKPMFGERGHGRVVRGR
ncbi:glycosyltransferase family 8 protein [Karstenula rhodostoma CBS 690.94]|uniref:Glycosyltransferase family 8 protein n=1 Tax=Karstenula rhodostoma CBS 690.94 TaxID=1392251 RepID=A0A9P4PK99_9PLEO|nr:glycosyltransferase family 8 protein [Karstenula rhodostoma CBS 690.94]